jgi:hypothetical protein
MEHKALRRIEISAGYCLSGCREKVRDAPELKHGFGTNNGQRGTCTKNT